MYGCESWTTKKAERRRIDTFELWFGEYSWESLGLQGDPSSPSYRKSILNIHWEDLCWSWNSNTLATWCEELTHWKRPWCWERLKAGGEGDDRGWGCWMASPCQWTWVWVSSGSWWWTGRPGVLLSMGSQRIRHNCVTELMKSPQVKPYSLVKSKVFPLKSEIRQGSILLKLLFNTAVKALTKTIRQEK